jgi:hypothetical protein
VRLGDQQRCIAGDLDLNARGSDGSSAEITMGEWSTIAASR